LFWTMSLTNGQSWPFWGIFATGNQYFINSASVKTLVSPFGAWTWSSKINVTISVGFADKKASISFRVSIAGPYWGKHLHFHTLEKINETKKKSYYAVGNQCTYKCGIIITLSFKWMT
jgi:hypothetical protein